MSNGAKNIGQAELTLENKVYRFDLMEGSEQEKAIDLRTLRKETGYISFDPGYVNTGSCQSSVTFIDGEQGILRYRGYEIDDVAEACSFLEVAHLLINGSLPTADELEEFSALIAANAMLPERMTRFLRNYPDSAHPMGVLSAMVVSQSAYHPEDVSHSQVENISHTMARLIGSLPTIAAFAYKRFVDQPFVYPKANLSYCENFLNMMYDSPVAPYEIDPVLVRALDRFLTLHADHEQNCSTSAVRLVGSSGADLYASISAGICALWGPLHGGANQRVIEMLGRIHEEGMTIDRVVERAKNKEDGFRLFGFGHRVYKTYDPRARIAKKSCEEVLERLGVNDPLLDIAIKLEERALSDDYFKERRLFPNVDFYTGMTLRALGIPTNMYTVLFAIGRLPGWLAQWLELTKDPDRRIGRPRQIYTGPNAKDVVRRPER